MNVLWLTNVSLANIAEKENISKTNLGGWIQGLYNSLKYYYKDEIKITLVFPNEIKFRGLVNNTDYYSFVETADVDEMEDFFFSIIRDTNPDVIHIFGTEYRHSYAMIKACEKRKLIDNTVVSIQGLVSISAKHMYNNLPLRTTLSYSLFDVKNRTSIRYITRDFLKRGEFEKKAISIAKNITGRTDWDKQCVYLMNKCAKYYHCGEILRDSFYKKEKWDVSRCKKNSIFFSQCDLSLKGVHNAIEALHILRQDYNDILLYIAGNTNIISPQSGLSSYERYVINIIKKYNLQNNVVFLGSQNEAEMHKNYLRANVFVCASSIENSSNSVCEAMIVGTPVVASQVGGMSSLIEHGKSGFLYQADAPYMLAYYIRMILNDDDLGSELSKNAVDIAQARHNRKEIVKELMVIYNGIAKCE